MSNTSRDIIKDIIDEEHESGERNRLSKSRRLSVSPSGKDKKRNFNGSFRSDNSNHSAEKK